MINAVVVVVVEGGSRERLYKAPVCANALMHQSSVTPDLELTRNGQTMVFDCT